MFSCCYERKKINYPLICILCNKTIKNYEIKLSCNHNFHKECIEKYIIQNKLCPICNIVYNYQLDF